MLNLGICRKCPSCQSLSPALVGEDGVEVRMSSVDCSLSPTGSCLGWRSEVPDGCPYILEHKMTEEAVADLVVMEGEEDDA